MTEDEGIESPDELTEEDKDQQAYWNDKLADFEKVIYPVFYARGYSKNTALHAYMIDQLDDAVILATASRHHERS